MHTTQLNLIKNQLLKNGSVSRNWCLQRFITRLGARIDDLKKEGMNINGKFVNTDYGKDYVYFLENQLEPIKVVEKPNQKQLFSTKRMY